MSEFYRHSHISSIWASADPRGTGEGQEWGLVAQSLGIKPGSADFKDLVGKAKDDAQKIKKAETETEAQAGNGDGADKQRVGKEQNKEGGRVESGSHEGGYSGGGKD